MRCQLEWIGEEKTGRATDKYKRTFWNAMRKKNFFDVENALHVGTDSEGGYLVPDEFEHTLVEALEEENFLRSLATVIQTSSGDRKIPVVASKGEAAGKQGHKHRPPVTAYFRHEARD